MDVSRALPLQPLPLHALLPATPPLHAPSPASPFSCTPFACRPFTFLTIYNVIRNQYFYLGETVLVEIPAAANFVVGTFVIVEMAENGNEVRANLTLTLSLTLTLTLTLTFRQVPGLAKGEGWMV